MNAIASSRRALLAALLALPCAVAIAQDPKVIRLIIPAPPAGNLDMTGRLVAQRAAALTGETWFIDNRPGGNTTVGTEIALRAPADGRTLLYHATGLVILPLQQKLAFSPLEDLAPVMQVSIERYALVVPASSAVTSIRGLEELAAQRPGGLNCVAVPGSSSIACEQVRALLRGHSTTIPFAGVAPALQTLIGGHADLMFLALEVTVKQAEAGRIRVIGVSTRKGLPESLAQSPLIADSWPDLQLEGLSGFFVPAATPPARVRELNRDLNRALADPQVNAAMRDAGQEPVGGTPEQFAQALRRAGAYYAEVIQKLDLGPK